jgi:hypothetical protein
MSDPAPCHSRHRPPSPAAASGNGLAARITLQHCINSTTATTTIIAVLVRAISSLTSQQKQLM